MKRCGVFSIIFLSFLLAACEAPNPAPAAGLGDSYPAPLNDPQISVLSADLRGWLHFSPAVVVRDDGRPLEVQVPVRNIAERQYNIDYRILFYDVNGAEVEPTMGWAFVSLQPKQGVRLKAKALDDRAESYRLEVKWAR